MATRPPGRPPNNLKVARQLVEDNLPKLTEKCLQLALMGDTQALGLLLDRAWPPPAELPVRLDAATIRKAMSRGHISGNHGAHLLKLVEGGECRRYPREGIESP